MKITKIVTQASAAEIVKYVNKPFIRAAQKKGRRLPEDFVRANINGKTWVEYMNRYPDEKIFTNKGKFTKKAIKNLYEEFKSHKMSKDTTLAQLRNFKIRFLG